MVRGLILAALLLLAGCAQTPEKLRDDPFEYVCWALVVECAGIPRPTIVYTELLDDVPTPPNVIIKGMHIVGEPYLFINANPDIPLESMESTVVHEMAHYIISYTLDVSWCDDEMLARLVTAMWKTEPYTEDWRKLYACQAEAEMEE